MPKISVIIPCYNYGKYVQEAVESVLGQTFRDYEIIVVNDGSTDEYTIEILEKLKNAHPEIKVIDQKNGHLANARNNGIKASSGEFILPLDADDVIEPTMLEKCYARIKDNEKLGVVYTQIRLFGDTDEVWPSHEFDFYKLLQINYIVATSLIRKKTWEDVGGYDEDMKSGYEDWEFYIRLAKNGWSGELIKEPLFFYRKHGKSMIEDTIKKHDLNVEYIKAKHADIYSEENMARLKNECELEKLSRIVSEKERELEFVRSSKFWKARNAYVRIKNIFKRSNVL